MGVNDLGNSMVKARITDMKVIRNAFKNNGLHNTQLLDDCIEILQRDLDIHKDDEKPQFLDPHVEEHDILVVVADQPKIRCKHCGEIVLCAINQTKGFDVWFHEHNKMQQCYTQMPIAEPDI